MSNFVVPSFFTGAFPNKTFLLQIHFHPCFLIRYQNIPIVNASQSVLKHRNFPSISNILVIVHRWNLLSLSPLEKEENIAVGRRSLHIHGSQSAIRAFFFFCLTRKSGELRGPNNRRQIEVRERERERWIIRWENINEGRPFVYKVELNPIFFTGWASKFERVARWREIFFLVLGHFGKRSPRERIREREWSFFREWN